MTELIVAAVAFFVPVTFVIAVREIAVAARHKAATVALLESRLLTLRTELTKTKAGRDYLEREARKQED